MDFIKEAINDAGERAAKEAMVDQASGALKNVLGGSQNDLIDKASSFAKQTLNNQSGNKTEKTTETTQSSFMDQASNLIKQTVQKQTTTTTTEGQNGEQKQQETTEKTTVKTDYIDKGISLVEEKVFHISQDQQNKAQNEKIAGFVRTGIEQLTHKGGNNNQEQQQQQ